MLADDLGHADVGFTVCKGIPTPHIDRLASTGLRFTNAYASVLQSDACVRKRSPL